MRIFRTHRLLLCLVLIVGLLPARAQTPQPSPDLPATADRIVHEILARTGVPSASVAIVRDGQIAYVQAYGDARLGPRTPARPDMRYSIGSISKQFTAAFRAIHMITVHHHAARSLRHACQVRHSPMNKARFTV